MSSTYINSGNAVLSSDRSVGATTAEIASICRKEFGFEKDIMLLSRADWAKLIKGNPFPEAVDKPTTLHAFALSKAPKPEAIAALDRPRGAARARRGQRQGAYFHAPEGFGTSKLPPVIDRTLGVVSTARNWNTVLKLMELAKGAS